MEAVAAKTYISLNPIGILIIIIALVVIVKLIKPFFRKNKAKSENPYSVQTSDNISFGDEVRNSVSSGMRKVIVRRESKLADGANKFLVYVDGMLVDSLENGRTIEFDVTANEKHSIYCEIKRNVLMQAYGLRDNKLRSMTLGIMPGNHVVTFVAEPSKSLDYGVALKQVGGGNGFNVKKS